MQSTSVATLGGTCSILVGVLYMVVGVIYLNDPGRRATNAGTLLKILERNSILRLLFHLVMAVTAVCALGAVPAISALADSGNDGWLRLATTVAYIGFAAMAIENFRALQILPLLVRDYTSADEATKVALARSVSLISLDPHGWLIYGGVGFWFFVVNVIALQRGLWPTSLAIVGLVGAVLYWMLVVGALFHKGKILLLVAGLGGLILGPIWYIWVGLIVR